VSFIETGILLTICEVLRHDIHIHAIFPATQIGRFGFKKQGIWTKSRGIFKQAQTSRYLQANQIKIYFQYK
jgi:hypothetical protein